MSEMKVITMPSIGEIIIDDLKWIENLLKKVQKDDILVVDLGYNNIYSPSTYKVLLSQLSRRACKKRIIVAPELHQKLDLKMLKPEMQKSKVIVVNKL